MFHILLEHIFDFQGVFGNLVLNSVVLDAVVEDEFHVVAEFLDIVVDVEGQFFFYCAEIHGVLYDVEVVIDVVTAGVDGLVEVVASFCFPAQGEHFLCGFDPGFFVLDVLQI